ncbi:hypothetical protein FACS189483_11130 [Spirochaetia bacterium]|nr:hypothetical protein FACS189483_11130 [Spirochaetia bacterium]
MLGEILFHDIIDEGLEDRFVPQKAVAVKTRGGDGIHRKSLIGIFPGDTFNIIPNDPRGTAVVGDASTAIGMTRFLANDYSFAPVVTIVTDNPFREEDRQRITERITNLEYAKAPDLFFEADHYNIMQKLREYNNITLLVGSSLEEEIALERNIQCQVMSFPVSDRLILNRTYAGYRGTLSLVEDLFNNL